MLVSPVLDSTSFSTLDVAGKAAVEDLFYTTYLGQQPLSLDNTMLFSRRKVIPLCFDFYSKKLAQTNPGIFKFLDNVQKESLRRDLLYSFYVFSAQYQLAAELSLDAAESRRENLQQCRDNIKRCAELIERLNDKPEAGQAYPHYVKALPHEGINVYIKDVRNKINTPRLYWVWASSWIQSWIELLPDNFFNKQQAQYVVLGLSPFTGFLSFSLYLTNAAIEMLMLAKHTWWSSEGEQRLKASAWQRFEAHFDLRKYSLINDGIWGLGNLVCFLWLTGTELLGYYGNIATTALLLMDVVLNGFRYQEESTQNQQNIDRYERDIKSIDDEIKQLTANADDFESQVLTCQMQALIKAKAQCRFEWKYKSYGLLKDLIYAVVLILAFAMVCCFFLPASILAPTTALVLSVGGTALCFISSLINDAMEGVFDVQKSYELSQQAEPIDALSGELLYLAQKQSLGVVAYYEALAHYQTRRLIHILFVKLLVPPLILSTLLFLPIEMGLMLLVSGFIIALASSYFFVGSEPEPAKLPSFDPTEYSSWVKEPSLETGVLQASPIGFFSEKNTSTNDCPVAAIECSTC
jgi:hypothetical protein